MFWEKVTNPKILLKLDDPPFDLFLPKCFGVVSHFPYLNVFQEFLREVLAISNGKSNVSLEDFVINFTMQIPLPPPKNVEIKFFIGQKLQTITYPEETSFRLGNVKSETHYLRISSFWEESHHSLFSQCCPLTWQFSKNKIPLHYVFKSLGSANVVKLFLHLMLEHKILFTCHNYTLLTFICEGLRLLFEPFDWPHVFVPVLPDFLLDFVYSPTPFILGIYSPNLSPLMKSEIKNVIFFNKNFILCNSGVN